MSGLETLPPDQRAVLRLILAQGHGYADLARRLKIEPEAVRARALAGLEALEPTVGADVTPERRGQIADYLLGEQDDGERIVTLAELGESAAASAWARALRARLSPLAREPLPDVLEPSSSNGAAEHPSPVVPLAPQAPPQAVAAAPAPPPEAPSEPAPVIPPAPPPSPRETPPAAEPPQRVSRLGGAILIGGAAVAAVVLAVVLLSGGKDQSGAAGPTTASTAARTTPAQASTQPTTTSTQPSGRIVGQVNLTAVPAGGQAVGIGFVQQSAGKLALAVEAQKLPANGTRDIYTVWLQGPAGAKFLGFVPNRVKANGTFTVSAPLPANAKSYTEVLVTRESIAVAPQQPGPTILTGRLKLS